MSSIWTENSERIHFEELKGDKTTDVLIIGGGISGILCAYMLSRAGVDYTLVEADKIAGGVTMNTTAKITLQNGFIYSKLISYFGVDIAKLYFKAHKEAIEEYDKLCKNIECDFEECDSYVYSLKNDNKAKEEWEALNKIGFSADFVTELNLPFKVTSAVRVKNQRQFNPLKFIYSIAKDFNIYENTKVLELVPDGAVTNRGKIKAKKIIATTHFPFINKHGGYFLKLYQHRSYVLALKNAPRVEGMYVDEDLKGLSFRNYGELLLLGGGSHRTGKKGGGWHELESFAQRYYPHSQEVCRWATQDCMSLDGVAYIGRYSKNTPNFYVITGFNKWGMATAMVGAMLLRDMILEKENPYALFFSPERSILRPQLALNIADSVAGLLTPTVPRCPHMGCALKYNKQEHSWDCACHGSRFTKEGKLINNPATDDLK